MKEEFRCKNCNKKLAELDGVSKEGTIEIKCPRCGEVNKI